MAGILNFENPFLQGMMGTRLMNQRTAESEIAQTKGLLGIQEAQESSQLKGLLGQKLQAGDMEGAKGILMQMKPELFAKSLVPKAPEYKDLGGSIGVIQDGKLVGQIPKSATPDASLREQGADRRHMEPSGSSMLSAQTTVRGQDLSAETTRRGQDVSAFTSRRGQDLSASTARRGQDLTTDRLGVGTYRLSDGSTVSRPQLIQQYKLDNNLMDDLDLQILAKTDPARAAREREKINSSMPFDQWAMDRFGVDVMGGRAGVPGLPRPNPGMPKPGAEQRKVLDGKAYVKRNGQWFAE